MSVRSTRSSPSSTEGTSSSGICSTTIITFPFVKATTREHSRSVCTNRLIWYQTGSATSSRAILHQIHGGARIAGSLRRVPFKSSHPPALSPAADTFTRPQRPPQWTGSVPLCRCDCRNPAIPAATLSALAELTRALRFLGRILNTASGCATVAVAVAGVSPADWSLDIFSQPQKAIPKGLYHSAQGCEERATLGGLTQFHHQP
jgi:hypothetical protein